MVADVGRVDLYQARPVWFNYNPNPAQPVMHCSCSGCPMSWEEWWQELMKLGDGLWSSGEAILADIARREGLLNGANFRMQELMAERNEKIHHAFMNGDPVTAEAAARAITLEYNILITQAAREFGDIGSEAKGTAEDEKHGDGSLVFIILCAIGMMVGAGLLSVLACRFLGQSKPSTSIIPNTQVVVGNPISSTDLGPPSEAVEQGVSMQKGPDSKA